MQFSSLSNLKIFKYICGFLFSLTIICGAEQPVYRYYADLTKIEKDQFKVILDCSEFEADGLVFQMPKIIPGTYKTANYGKYIKHFEARDENGNIIPHKKKGKNTFIISKAKDLNTISYWVKDTWDAKFVRNYVYPMAGTNISEGTNFVINSGGIFGYFEGMVGNAVEIDFTVPDSLFGLSILKQEKLVNG